MGYSLVLEVYSITIDGARTSCFDLQIYGGECSYTSYLLNPIRKALEFAGFSTFSGLRSNALGWGAFHLGFPNNDPEPGRCCITDGKKWRCSKDAVADQRYCERHINRGRNHSRKPVEGQSGHSSPGITDTNVKRTPIISSASVSVVPVGGVSNSLGLSHRQRNNQQVDVSNTNR